LEPIFDDMYELTYEMVKVDYDMCWYNFLFFVG